MLLRLVDAVVSGATERNIDPVKLIQLIGHSKEINYGTIRIPENVRQIEEELESENLFDALLIIRSYIILTAEWELQANWLDVVHRIEAATGIVLGRDTVNPETKEEYYRHTTVTAKEYGARSSVDRPLTSAGLWTNNDWLAVLWMMSFVPLESLKRTT